MKGFFKAFAAAGLCMCMALGVTACGQKALDGKQVAATVGEKEMTLGEANFLLRYQQSQSEAMYESMAGEGFYDRDLTGSGKTFGQTMKDGMMNSLRDYYILKEKAADYGVTLTEEEKAAVKSAAETFLKANDKYTREQMTADEETVESVLTLMTYAAKMREAIIAEANVTVSDEEAAQRGFDYIKVSKTVTAEGSKESRSLSDDEIAEKKAALNEAAALVQGGTDFKAAAETKELTAAEGSYSADNTGTYPEEVIAALEGLAEGEMSGIVETDEALYLLKVTADVDTEATEARRASLKSLKEGEYYNGLMQSWYEEYPLEVKEDVWAQVVFDRSYDMVAK